MARTKTTRTWATSMNEWKEMRLDATTITDHSPPEALKRKGA